MNIIGKTVDDKMVVDSVFELYDTVGLPLEDVFIMLKNQNMIPDIISFYEDALLHN